MTDTERLAFLAAFLTAVVVAGLALSYVPHVELVTLVVFASGILLGAGRGMLVGGVGMPLYVFTNTALKGFPPSPLPVLLAQALGMMLPGLAGGWWRRHWLAAGVPRGSALLLLPVLGVMLAAWNQAILNLSFVLFLTDTPGARTTLFVSGMAFGLLDMVWNGVVFAVAGPPVASLLRRTARRRGWWGAVLVLFLVAGMPGASRAQTAGEGGEADSLVEAAAAAAAADSAAGVEEGRIAPAPPESTAAPVTARAAGMRRLRPLVQVPPPLWKEVPASEASVFGTPTVPGAGILTAGELSRTDSPNVPRNLERWGLGWGRVRYEYDGLPLGGPVHALETPPDLPAAWRGAWSTKRTASGTDLALAVPPPQTGEPLSQVSLTTGALGRRTAEFGLFRGLGPVNLGVDFEDREGQGFLSNLDGDRVWIHLSPEPGRRPAWSVDLSNGSDTQKFLTGGSLGRDVRRLQVSLHGPSAGGETRFGLQLRRVALQLDRAPGAFGEILFDGYTLQGDWAPPVPGLTVRARWDHQRRRGLLAEAASWDGFTGHAAWARTLGELEFGADLTAGHQEPYGFTWGGSALVGMKDAGWEGFLCLSHEEELPPLVLGVDRPAPEEGMEAYLLAYETAANPESRTALRAEGSVRGSRASLTAGGWVAHLRGIRTDSNPLWSETSLYAPIPYPGERADLVGAYGEGRLDLVGGFFGQGQGRVTSRDLEEVPYLSRWTVDGSLHWRRPWFHESIDLDAAIGGGVVGPRRNPDGQVFPSTAIGYAELLGRVDNGILTVRFQNLAGSYMESDLRLDDLVTPFPVAGRTLIVGLTMYLTQ